MASGFCEFVDVGRTFTMVNQTWLRNLEDFGEGYRQFHEYFALTLCLFGVISNIFFIIILTRRDMVSPVNTILTSIAVCDMALMTSYFVWLLNFYRYFQWFGQSLCDSVSVHWARFSLFHANASVYLHTASLWQTVLLAGVRWYCLRDKRGTLIGPGSLRKIRLMILGTLGFVGILTASNTISLTYTDYHDNMVNCTVYAVFPSQLSTADNCALQKVNLWIGGVCHKFIPCCLLTVFMGLLLHVMYKAQVRRKRLLANSKTTQHQHHHQDRTTITLILIVFLFWLTELPQGILTILTGYFGWWFREGVYNPLGDLFDDLSLINSSINFVLYCMMSSQFRRVVKHTFSFRHNPMVATNVKDIRDYSLVNTSPRPSPNVAKKSGEMEKSMQKSVDVVNHNVLSCDQDTLL